MALETVLSANPAKQKLCSPNLVLVLGSFHNTWRKLVTDSAELNDFYVESGTG